MDALNLPASGLIKICGLTRAEDVSMCARAGADWLGFIFHPQSPRWVSPKAVAGFDSGRAKRVGVFVNQTSAEVLRIMGEAQLDLVQLHGSQDENFIKQIGAERVISVQWPEKFSNRVELSQALEARNSPAFYLFDAGGSGGGHGRQLSLSLLDNFKPPRPWLLAGGLTPEKVKDLPTAGLIGLAGFDFNSGLEDQPGQKNEYKVQKAIAAARIFLDDYHQNHE